MPRNIKKQVSPSFHTLHEWDVRQRVRVQVCLRGKTLHEDQFRKAVAALIFWTLIHIHQIQYFHHSLSDLTLKDIRYPLFSAQLWSASVLESCFYHKVTENLFRSIVFFLAKNPYLNIFERGYFNLSFYVGKKNYIRHSSQNNRQNR